MGYNCQLKMYKSLDKRIYQAVKTETERKLKMELQTNLLRL